MAKVENFNSFMEIKDSEKLVLLKALGYSVNKHGFIIEDLNNKIVWCRYTNVPVKFEEASILPGSTVVINTTPVSLSSYIEEFLEDEG